MRRQKVFALLVNPCEPRALFPTGKLRFGLLRERHVELEMAITRRLVPAGLAQPVLRVLAHRFQHGVARRAPLDTVRENE